MQKLNFSIEIKASSEKVWKTLWEDKTFRKWADIIDEGMYLVGEMKEGNGVQFVSPKGYVVNSLIEKFILNQVISFRHMADKNDGDEKDNEWTGGEESYSLTENDGTTTLTIDMDVPPEQEENFNNILPKVLEMVKLLAEKKE